MRSTKLLAIVLALLSAPLVFGQATNAEKKGKGKGRAAQPPPLQNVRTTAIAGVVAANTPVQVVKEGFASTEGPVALPDGTLAFTETSQSKIHRIDANNNVSLYLENTNGANALGFDGKGRLIAVQTVAGKTQVGPIGKNGAEAPLAPNFNGKPFSRPNDITVGRNGNIYFTDMGAGGSGVYRISAKGELTQINHEIQRPNGITLSPDEKKLYVANVGGEYVLAFDVAADGAVSHKRDFAKLAEVTTDAKGEKNSGADGLAIDSAGRLYVASNPGVQVFSATGQALGIIPTPVRPQNIAFAGPDKSTFYIVGRGNVYKIAMLTKGFAGRAESNVLRPLRRKIAARLWRFRWLLAGGVPVYVVSLVLHGQSNDSGPENYNQPTQPVPFSHATHAGADLDCRYCHTTVETSNHPRAAEEVCLKCHKSPAKDRPGFALVRQAAKGGAPVPWVKVNSVPDWITFNHSTHVRRGVSCESCHGRVDQMETTFQAESLSMGWCMDCHTDPTPYLREQQEVTAMGFKPQGGARAYGQKIKNERGISPDNGCVYCHRPRANAKTLDDLLAPSK